MKRNIKKTILFLLFLSPIRWAGYEVFPSNPHMNFDIQSHHLNIFSMAGTVIFFLKRGDRRREEAFHHFLRSP